MPASTLKAHLREIAQLVVFLLAIALIVSDSIGRATLSWQAIALFAVVAIMAVLNDLEKLDLGDFGGVRFSEEIDEAQQTVDALDEPKSSPQSSPQRLRSESGESLSTDETDHTATLEDGTVTSSFDAEETEMIAARLYDLLEVDPQYALVQLRLELEKARNANSSEVVSNDTAQFVLEATDTELVNAYDDVTSLCTSAVHSSEEITCSDATRVIDLGLRVLDHLLSREAVTD